MSRAVTPFEDALAFASGFEGAVDVVETQRHLSELAQLVAEFHTRFSVDGLDDVRTSLHVLIGVDQTTKVEVVKKNRDLL